MNQYLVRSWPTLTILLALVPAMPIFADPAPTYHSLLTRLNNLPTAVEADALHEAAQARVEQASTHLNPTISFETESILGTGDYRNFRSAESVLSVSQPLEIWGQRSARIASAEAGAEAASYRKDLTQLHTAGNLALVYANAEAAQERYLLAQEALTLAEDDAQAAAYFVEEGREAQLSLIQAQSEVASAQAVVDEYFAEQQASYAYLSAFALLDKTVTNISESLLYQVPNTPNNAHEAIALKLAEAELNQARHQVKIETLRARPEVTATVGFQRFEESHDQSWLAGISVSVPLFDQNKGGIRAAQAEQRAAEARLLQQQHTLKAQLEAAHARHSASISRIKAAQNSIETSEQAYQLARLGFESGRISQLELRSTRATLITAKFNSIEAHLASIRAEVDIAALQGRAPFQEI